MRRQTRVAPMTASLLEGGQQLPELPGRFHVLVVDDDPMLRRAVAVLVNSPLRRVTECGSAVQAIESMQKDSVDLVLLDLYLPDASGFEVMRINSNSHSPATVIVVSGDDRIDSAIASLNAGAHEYVRKPFEPAALIRSVENALAARRLEWENSIIRMRMEHSERLHRYFVDNSPDLIFALDPQGRFRFANDRLVTLLGCSKDELAEMHYSAIIHEEDLPGVAWVFRERRTGERASRNVEVRLKAKPVADDLGLEGEAATVAVSSVGIYGGGVAPSGGGQLLGTYCVARDVSTRVRAEQIIAFHAFHDGLTGLPNRTLFRDRLGQAIAETRRRRKFLAILFIDLDRFKVVNDTYGHLAGDLLLQQTASRLRKCLRGADTISRIGGDEFVALISDLDKREDAEVAASKILHELIQPFTLGTDSIHSSVSIGISVYPGDGANEDDLIRNADLAMYQAKKKGKNGCAFFLPELSTLQLEKLQFEKDLRGAVERQEFELYFQPIHNVRTRVVERLEALVRWRHPTHGLLSPTRFIGIAEESGQIRELGEFVLDSDCAHLAGWRSQGLTGLGVSVNLSPRDFDRTDLVERVVHATGKYAIPSGSLELEITENVLIEDMDAVSKRASRLRSQGIHIAIDDFGTRYSSLGYLQTLPISTIKIDQSFVRDLGLRDSNAAIVAAMIGIARALNLGIVAEGVERTEQLNALQELGCELMQGYLFSRPLPGPEVRDYLIAFQKRS